MSGKPQEEVYIKQRPLDIAALQDNKITQRAVVAVLNGIYEKDL